MQSSVGSSMSALAIASCCCSPPESTPAWALSLSANLGKSVSPRSMRDAVSDGLPLSSQPPTSNADVTVCPAVGVSTEMKGLGLPGKIRMWTLRIASNVPVSALWA